DWPSLHVRPGVSARPPPVWTRDWASYAMAAAVTLPIVAAIAWAAVTGALDVRYAFAATVAILVAGAAWGGVCLHRLAREAEDHRRRYLEAMAAREHDLQVLKVGETKFRTLISNIPGVAYRCADDADYTMEFISDDIAELSGYPSSHFVHH